jgi:uncharacterized protein
MNKTKAFVQELETWFSKHPKVLIALSGGVDSCLVAFLARKFLGKENAIAVVSNSASLKAKDFNDALTFASTHDIKLIEIDANEIEDPNYAKNPVDRCYFCKSNLYAAMQDLINSRYAEFKMVNGNNFSDFGDYRPGIEAANENGVYSPLADCKVTKDQIRKLSKYFNLEVWDKPASPCLSSRFPYGESISEQKLFMVEQAEDFVNTMGFTDVRVRYRQGEACVEVPVGEINLLEQQFNVIKSKLLNIGFHKASIDREGLISGKLNRGIIKNNEKHLST